MKEVLLALNQQPIAVYPIYIDITGSVTAGLLLSQIMYWNAKMKGKEFYKNDTEYMEETRLTQSEFKTAKKIVSGLSFLKIERKGAPYRTYYSVDHNELFVVLQRFSSSFTYELGSRLSTSQRGVNLRTIIGTENTQEITTENTTVVETSSTVTLIDEVDETSVEMHHVPDYFEEAKKYYTKAELQNEEFMQKEKEAFEKSEYTLLSDISKATEKPKEKVSQKRKGATSAEDMDLVFQVVTYLNEKTEQAFQPGGEKTKSLILARHHADKWSLEDFKTVIDHKKSEWFVKDNLRQYLRPSTLFAAGHAEEYLQAAKLWNKKPIATSPGVVPLFRQENFVNTDRSKFKF